ncbi:hypothetical protein LINPERPRIM_LOCUS8649, partial [Linum perenne]
IFGGKLLWEYKKKNPSNKKSLPRSCKKSLPTAAIICNSLNLIQPLIDKLLQLLPLLITLILICISSFAFNITNDISLASHHSVGLHSLPQQTPPSDLQSLPQQFQSTIYGHRRSKLSVRRLKPPHETLFQQPSPLTFEFRRPRRSPLPSLSSFFRASNRGMIQLKRRSFQSFLILLNHRFLPPPDSAFTH